MIVRDGEKFKKDGHSEGVAPGSISGRMTQM